MKKYTIYILLLGIAPILLAQDVLNQIQGKWSGFSRMIYSIYGSMVISKNTITFEKLGKFNFSVISTYEDSLIIHIPNNFDCGQYYRLGPIEFNDEKTEKRMEFYVYSSLDEVNKSKRTLQEANTYSHYCSWGLYEQIQSNN